MSALFHRFIRRHSNKTYFSFMSRCKKYHTFSDLTFQLIAKVTQSVHIYVIYRNSQQSYAIYLYSLIHNITHCFLCSFALKRFVFAGKGFYFCLQMFDLLKYICRSCLQCFCCCLKHLLQLVIVIKYSL